MNDGIGQKSRPRIGFNTDSIRVTPPFHPNVNPATLPPRKNPITNPEELFKRLSIDTCVFTAMCPDFKAEDLQRFLDRWFSKYRIQILP